MCVKQIDYFIGLDIYYSLKLQNGWITVRLLCIPVTYVFNKDFSNFSKVLSCILYSFSYFITRTIMLSDAKSQTKTMTSKPLHTHLPIAWIFTAFINDTCQPFWPHRSFSMKMIYIRKHLQLTLTNPWCVCY